MSSRSLYLRPLGLIGPEVETPDALPLAGGALAFTACEAILRDTTGGLTRELVSLAALGGWAHEQGVEREVEVWLERLSAPRPSFAGLAMERPQIMGVINVTPDSFSDAGDRFDPGRAVADGLAMVDAGAALLDVGGESTRPGAESVPEEEELRRVIPIIRALAGAGVPISIDTRRARVMAEALYAGAAIINDVTALTGDPESLPLAAEAGVPVILMHMQGEPRTMQQDPTYEDAALDIFDWLADCVAACEAAGIPRRHLAVDPGIGFGKTLRHNLELLEQLALFHGIGCSLVLGVSRKSFIGRLSRQEPPKERMPGSIAAALAGLERGVQILRVHDVAETVQAVEVWRAIAAPGPDEGLRASA